MKNSQPDKRNSKLSMTNVRKLLSQAAFNPNSPGPLSVVAHSGNPSYFETRAMEYVEEAKMDRMAIREIPSSEAYTGFVEINEQYKQKMIRGIQMLVIAILKVEEGER